MHKFVVLASAIREPCRAFCGPKILEQAGDPKEGAHANRRSSCGSADLDSTMLLKGSRLTSSPTCGGWASTRECATSAFVWERCKQRSRLEAPAVRVQSASMAAFMKAARREISPAIWAGRPSTGQVVRAAVEETAYKKNNFDVILHQSPAARSLFREWVEELRCPYSKFWTSNSIREWMDSHEVLASEQMLWDQAGMPVLVMNGATPCGSAFYSDANQNFNAAIESGRSTFFNAYQLHLIIRGEGDECRYAGAAILCYLIKNSRNRAGEFSPMYVEPIYDEPWLTYYYNSFNCTRPNYGSDMLRCRDQHPAKCGKHAMPIYDGDAYFSKLLHGSDSSGAAPSRSLPQSPLSPRPSVPAAKSSPFDVSDLKLVPTDPSKPDSAWGIIQVLSKGGRQANAAAQALPATPSKELDAGVDDGTLQPEAALPAKPTRKRSPRKKAPAKKVQAVEDSDEARGGQDGDTSQARASAPRKRRAPAKKPRARRRGNAEE